MIQLPLITLSFEVQAFTLSLFSLVCLRVQCSSFHSPSPMIWSVIIRLVFLPLACSPLFILFCFFALHFTVNPLSVTFSLLPLFGLLCQSIVTNCYSFLSPSLTLLRLHPQRNYTRSLCVREREKVIQISSIYNICPRLGSLCVCLHHFKSLSTWSLLYACGCMLVNRYN